MILLLGVDRFMAEARSVTTLIGHAVACQVIGRWEGALAVDRAKLILNAESPGKTTDFVAVQPAAYADTPRA